jgi:hypothetical protein
MVTLLLGKMALEELFLSILCKNFTKLTHHIWRVFMSHVTVLIAKHSELQYQYNWVGVPGDPCTATTF